MPAAIQGYVGVGVETTPATSVTPKKFIPAKSASFPIDNEIIDFVEIRGNRQAQQKFDGALNPSVSITTAAYPTGFMGVLLRALFGDAGGALVAPSSTVYKHTFYDSGTALPSLSFERTDKQTSGGLLHERVPGCKIESISFTAEFGADVEMQIEAQGLSFPETPVSKASPITYPAQDPFIFTGVTVDIDGVPNNLFKSLNFDFTNTLERQQSLRGSRNAYRLHEGRTELTLGGTLIYEDNSIRDMFRDSTEFSVSTMFTGGVADATNSLDYYLGFTWPRVKVQTFEVNFEAEGVMEAEVEFNVIFDQSVGTNGAAVVVELQNTEPVATYTT